MIRRNRDIKTSHQFTGFFLVVLFFFILFHSFSQQPEECLVKLSRQYILSYWDDGWDAALAPLEWNKTEWLAFSAITVSGVLVYRNDKEIFNIFHDNQSDFTANLSKYVAEPFGNPFVTVSLAGALYLYGLVSNDEKSERTGLLGIEALLINGAITLAAKYVLNRQRPSASSFKDPYQWYGPLAKEYHGAFPSGHTSSAFTLATIVASSCRDIRWIPPAVYSLATIAGLSRIHDAKHWPSDVIFGAALGYGVGKLVYNNHCNNSGSTTVSVFPSGKGCILLLEF